MPAARENGGGVCGDLLTAARARLGRIRATGDPASALEPQAEDEVRHLDALLRDGGDFEAGAVLGWLHWYRHRALGADGEAASREREAAARAFVGVFAVDAGEVPGPLLPLVADAVDAQAMGEAEDAWESSDPESLAEAAALWRRITRATPAEHPERARRFSVLAGLLFARFDRAVSDRPDTEAAFAPHAETYLESAIDAAREAVEATADDDPARADRLCELGAGWDTRFGGTQAATDLDTAIDCHRRAVESAGTDHPNRAVFHFRLAAALGARYALTRSPADLEASLRHHERAVEATDPVDPVWAERLSVLATMWEARFDETHEAADLERAVHYHEQAVRAAPDDDPARAELLTLLGHALGMRFDETGEPADLDLAVRYLEDAVRAEPNQGPEYVDRLDRLADALLARFHATGQAADLDAAITARREAVRSAEHDDPDRAPLLSELGEALYTRYELTGSQADLEHAVDVHLVAVSADGFDGHDDPALEPYRSRLGNALAELRLQALLARLRRCRETGDPSPVLEDEAGEEARELASLRSFKEAESDHALGLFHWLRSCALPEDQVGTPEAEAFLWPLVRCFVRGVDELPELLLPLLAEAAAERHGPRATELAEASLEPGPADEAVALWERIVRATPAQRPERSVYLVNLAEALRTRYSRTGQCADLDAAISHYEQALRATSATQPDDPALLSDLGATLRQRFERTGNLADAHAAVDRQRAAERAAVDGFPDRPLVLDQLGVALKARFTRTGRTADLDESIAWLRAAERTVPADDPARALCLNNLGDALHTRFLWSGRAADLDEAIMHLRAAEQLPRNGSPHHPHLQNLGGVLWRRWLHTARVDDLEAAIDHLTEALETLPGGHPARAACLNNLGLALRERYRFSVGVRHVITELGQGAPEVPGHDLPAADLGTEGRRSLALHIAMQNRATPTQLAGVFAAMLNGTDPATDLDTAVDHFEEVLELTPDDDPFQARFHDNLGATLTLRFGRTGAVADLDRAIHHHEQAVRATPDGDSVLRYSLFQLGEALDLRYGRTGSAADLDAAAAAMVQAAAVRSGPPTDRARAAWQASRLLRTVDVGKAAEMAEAAVHLLTEAAHRRLERADRQRAIGQLAGLATEAAALALTARRQSGARPAEQALRLLESGRAVLLGQAWDLRGDLTRLGESHPELAADLTALRDRLDGPAPLQDLHGTSVPHGLPLDAPEHDEHRHRDRLAEELAATLDRIRALTGFASFALPPDVEELLTGAAEGPVVVFSISDYRSDALLLTTEGVAHLELPALTVEAVTDRVVAFRTALTESTSAAGGARQRRQAQAVLTGTLEWLWDSAVGPVLAALGFEEAPVAGTGWPRVWWVPGGLLSQLPLHAAGHHRDPADSPHRRTVMDRVTSSYTPTVRALLHSREQARRRAAEPDASARALIVAMPTTPGLPGEGRLAYVTREAEVVRAHLVDHVLLERETQVDGEPAAITGPTRARVLAHLTGCPIAHFACHGDSHPTDPSLSRLLLQDHADAPLTVSALTSVELGRAELAYLSACRTAALDTPALADEAIHMTSAFQLAGFPRVIGTMWEINDEIAVTVADAFYTGLRSDSGRLDTRRSAHALHAAVRAVRDAYPATPSLWAAYLHAGA
ncbi:CHAT domain-containing protein [Streptomyces parvus]|uniref:CHAT domain-containing protein n=1 Tax=Streptomyces parvus TaxID=66428 RepID=UPI0033EE86A2